MSSLNTTVAKPIEWSGASELANRGFVGLVTVATPGIFSSSATVRAMAAAVAGSVSEPEGAWKTTWAVASLAVGKSWLSTSTARWDSVPGMVNTSLVVPPERPATTPSTTSTATQAPITHQWWWAAPRPSRSSIGFPSAGTGQAQGPKLRRVAGGHAGRTAERAGMKGAG